MKFGSQNYTFNLKPVFGGRQIWDLEAVPAAGGVGNGMRISPLGPSKGEKDPWEVRLREMYQPQQERFLAAGYAALFLPSNSCSFFFF